MKIIKFFSLSLILLGACFGCETAQAKNQKNFVWSSIDVRYQPQQEVQECNNPILYAWRGERVNLQAVFSSEEDTEIKISASDLKCGKSVIPSACVSCYYEDYVITNTYSNHEDSFLVADHLAASDNGYAVETNTPRPVWFNVWVPQDAAPGKYKGTVTLENKEKKYQLAYTLNVSARVLPEPKDWTYHLDLWQNPYAVARFFKVPLWSKAHFDAMRPIMERYAQAGGKVITTSITYHPWKAQTYIDPFESMIVKTKHIDGSWSYDYTVFDKWVEFMMSCGITKQIACYTIVPWAYQFEYLDQATASTQYVKAKPGEKAYEDYMLPFLTDFAKHLKAKGWFDRTCIAMDERPVDALKIAWDIVQRADKDYRIEGAVNYKPTTVSVISQMQGVSVGYNHVNLPAEVVKQRQDENRITTIYTCCGPDRPNTFVASDPAEAAFIGWHITAMKFDGYLRWALNSWPLDPNKDCRYSTWPGGDAYLLYPMGSSIRWERLIEGIQVFEKIRILKEEGSEEVQSQLEEILKPFSTVKYPKNVNAAEAVNKANAALRKLE